MKPPISISVTTDNAQHVFLTFRGAGEDDGMTVVVPSQGNAYQGLHAAREEIEGVVNTILGINGVKPAPTEATDDEKPKTRKSKAPPES